MFCNGLEGLADVCVTNAELRAVIDEVVGERRCYVTVKQVTDTCINAKISTVVKK